VYRHTQASYQGFPPRFVSQLTEKLEGKPGRISHDTVPPLVPCLPDAKVTMPWDSCVVVSTCAGKPDAIKMT